MSKIYKNDSGIKFLFFTNYKVMNSFLVRVLAENFPGIKVFTSIDKINESDNYIKLAIVRNPYDRILSLFFDKCKEQPKRIINQKKNIFLQVNQAQIIAAAEQLFNKQVSIVEPGKEIEKNSDAYPDFLTDLAVLESLEFPEFIEIVRYLFSLPEKDAHFQPQSEIMLRNGELIIDKYFKLEHINECWGEICNITGKQMILTYGANRTNFEGPEKAKRFYTEDLQKIVFDLYQTDFENFAYDKGL